MNSTLTIATALLTLKKKAHIRGRRRLLCGREFTSLLYTTIAMIVLDETIPRTVVAQKHFVSYKQSKIITHYFT